jgi:hypothetical protein
MRRPLSALIIAISLPALTTQAQPRASKAGVKVTVPRTPDGHPDLQGIWANLIITPLERPKDLLDKEFLTKEEAVAFEKHPLEYYRRLLGTLEDQTSGELNETWLPPYKVLPNRRTSLIVDPPNGRIPPLTPDAQRRLDAAKEREKEHAADGPEDLPARERCLVWGAGPPIIPVPFSYYVQIVQTRNYVMILTEMVHDARVIPLDGRPHLPLTVRQWKGDSRGRWEGDTLVVDTTNFLRFNTGTPFSGWDERLHVVERIKRTDNDTLLYEFTIDDPTAFTSPWSAAYPMKRTSDQIFEFACHEANYSIENILRGARAKEAQETKGSKK